jgi:hypothetical protein
MFDRVVVNVDDQIPEKESTGDAFPVEGMLKQAAGPVVGFVISFCVGIEQIGKVLIRFFLQTVKVSKPLTVSAGFFLPYPDQQMKMVGHKYPGVGIRNWSDVLVV